MRSKLPPPNTQIVGKTRLSVNVLRLFIDEEFVPFADGRRKTDLCRSMQGPLIISDLTVQSYSFLPNSQSQTDLSLEEIDETQIFPYSK